MMEKKFQIGILFGGSSAEHEISIMSASFILESLDKSRFIPRMIGITREGFWLNPKDSKEGLKKNSLQLVRGQDLFSFDLLKGIDIVFPILHGPFGEDGTIQGLLETLKIPYVGSGVLGSSVGMDKEAMKNLFAFHKLPQTPYLTFTSPLTKERKEIEEQIIDSLGLPCFVKPANMGSSLGINLVRRREDLLKALDEAFLHDHKILVERRVEGREIEFSLLGGRDPLVSIPGEVIPAREFYDYQAKYSEGLSRLVIPASLSPEKVNEFQDLARKAYEVTFAYGLARVDFFLTKEEEVLINEINTMPGFTKYSMYPRLFKESGMDGTELVSNLLDLAIER